VGSFANKALTDFPSANGETAPEKAIKQLNAARQE
jgi:hypothetical protein